MPKQLALFLVGFAPPEVGTPGEPGGLFFAYLLILLMVVVLIRVYRRKPSYAFFGGWLFITLLPVSNLLPLPNPVAWRYLYLPSVGFACSLGLGLWWLGAQGHEFPILKEKRKIINIIAFSLILFYATIAFSRNLIWRDDLSLMLDSVYYYPQNPQTHYNLGRLYYERGQTAKAEEEFGCVIQLAASHKGAHRNLGRCYFKEGRFEAAEREFVREIQLYPDEVTSRDLLGFIALERKNLDRAAGFLREAAQLDPEDALSYAILGEVYFQQGDYGKAQESWGKALQLRPGDGFLLYRLGRLKELLDKRTGRKGEEG